MRLLPAAPGASLWAPGPLGRGDCKPGPATRWPAEPPRRAGTAIRVDRGRARSAVWTFTNPATARTVTLVGTIHIGEPAYFHDLSAAVQCQAATGAEVHVEGIGHRPHERLTEWEWDRLAEAGSWADPETTGAAVTLLRTQSQGAGLRLPEGTRNIDLSDLELLRRVGWAGYRRLFAPSPAPGPAPALGPVVRAAIRFQLRHGQALKALKSLRPRNRRVNRVVIGERNRLAHAGGAEALTRGDVVLVWGADHLPGLARLFERDGYRLRQEEWFEACTV